jgi:phosphoglycolate phosphatase
LYLTSQFAICMQGEIMKQVDLILFDFDGTLVETATDLVQAINFMLRTLRLQERTKEEIISFVGDGINSLIERALGQQNAEHNEKALDIFTSYYSTHLLDNAKLYHQVEDVLINFASKTKIILTNKRYKYTLPIAQGLNIEKYFVEIIGSDSTPYKKPDSRVVDLILNKYGTAKEKTVIIGDGVNDILVAKESGILCCAFLNGLGNRQDLLSLNADYYVENLLEVNNLFN